MPRNVEWRLIVDETGAIKKMEMTGREAKNLDKKFDKTKKESRSLGQEIKNLGSSFGGLKGMIGMGLGALGAGGLAFGLKDILSKTKETLEQTEKFSAISGTGTQSSLYYTAALKARGINAESAGKAFAFLSSNIKTAERQEYGLAVAQSKAGAKGKQTTSLLGRQATAFRELLGPRGVAGLAHMTGEQKLATVVKAFENMSPAMKKTGVQAALMKEIFSRSGLSLATVLQGGATGLTHFTEVAKKFMPEIKGGAKGMEEWQLKNSEFKMGVEGLEVSLGMKLLPVVMEVESWFTKVAGQIESGKGIWGGLGRDVEGVATAIKGVVGLLEKMGKAFKIPIEAGGFGAALAAFAGIHTLRHPVKAATTSAKIMSGAGKFALKHPEFAPVVGALVAGASTPFIGAAYAKAGGEAIHPGIFKLHSPTEQAEQALFGKIGIKPMGYGQTHLVGRSIAPPAKVATAALLSRLLEHPNLITSKSASGLSRGDLQYLAAQFHKAHEREPKVIQVTLDGRVLVEAHERYALKQAARR
jgi:hypothetical protein